MSAAPASRTTTTQMGDPSGLALPPSVASDLGRSMMGRLRQSNALMRDPVTQAYIQAFGSALADPHPQATTDFHFAVADNHTINAFAMPGGYIVVFSGLIEQARTPSELAGVLAHELAHIRQHHMARMLANQSQHMAPVMVGILTAVAASAAGRPDLASGAILSGQSQSVVQQLHQNRQYEHEADRMGMQTLIRAQLDPQGMPDFLQRMQQSNMAYGQHSDYLSTHPLMTARIADTQARAAAYQRHHSGDHHHAPDPTSVLHNLPLFECIQIRVQILGQYDLNTLQHSYLAQLNQRTPHTRHHHATQTLDAHARALYALALIDHQNHDDTAAAKKLRALIKQYPDFTLFQYDLAQTLTRQHQDAPAIAQLLDARKNLHTPYWLQGPIDLALASNHQALQQWSAAQANLQSALHLNDDQPDVYMQLAQLQARQGHTALAFLSRAKAYAINLNLSAAIAQVQEALRQPHVDAFTKHLLNQQLQKYKAHQARLAKLFGKPNKSRLSLLQSL